jgi:hypothetical protein
MSEQLDFDFYGDRDKTIQERFERFDRENPIVYELLLRFVAEARGSGARRLGVRTLWERMRWYVFFETRDPSGLKLNDHYHSRYVRKLIKDDPTLETFFELRKLRAP